MPVRSLTRDWHKTLFLIQRGKKWKRTFAPYDPVARPLFSIWWLSSPWRLLHSSGEHPLAKGCCKQIPPRELRQRLPKP